MKFEEIFNEDGKYMAEGFKEGVCFEIKDGIIYLVTYENKNDLIPNIDNCPVYKNLFTKEFKKVFTIRQLFS